MTLYQECISLEIPCHNHYSDLYIPVTTLTTGLLKKHNKRATTFVNQVEGGLWYDVPFQYDPYWESKMSRHKAL